jgi:hypothetical protein
MGTTKSNAVISGIVPEQELAGVLQCRTIEHTPGADLPASDIVQMCPVVPGMKIIDIKLSFEAFGASRTLDIGDGGDVDRFFDGLDVSAVGKATQYVGGANAGLNHKYSAEDTIDITVLGGTWPSGVTVKMNVIYKMAGAIADEG